MGRSLTNRVAPLMSLSSPSGGQGDNVAPIIRRREPTYCCSLFLGWLFNEEDLPHPRLAAGTTMLQSKPMRPRRTTSIRSLLHDAIGGLERFYFRASLVIFSRNQNLSARTGVPSHTNRNNLRLSSILSEGGFSLGIYQLFNPPERLISRYP